MQSSRRRPASAPRLPAGWSRAAAAGSRRVCCAASSTRWTRRSPRTPPGWWCTAARGRAARSWAAYDAICAALERLGDDETLIVQSGKPVAVLPTHHDAPRVLISTAMLVPAWSGDDEFRRLEEAGLTMYGQMTAASWFYIGTQGILGFTHETFAAVARRHFGGTLAGRRVVSAGLGGMGGAQGLAIANLGGRALLVEVDPRARPAAARRRLGGSHRTRLRGGGGRPDRIRRAGGHRPRRQRRGGASAAGARPRPDRRRHRSDPRPRHRGGLRPARLPERPPMPRAPRTGRAVVRSLRDHGDALVALQQRRRGRLRVRQQPALPGRRRGVGGCRRAAGVRRGVRAADPRARRRPVPLGVPERRSRRSPAQRGGGARGGGDAFAASAGSSSPGRA